MAKHKQPNRTCGECIHQWACEAWNCGNLTNAAADWCTNFERARDLWEVLKGIFGKEDDHARD